MIPMNKDRWSRMLSDTSYQYKLIIEREVDIPNAKYVPIVASRAKRHTVIIQSLQWKMRKMSLTTLDTREQSFKKLRSSYRSHIR